MNNTTRSNNKTQSDLKQIGNQGITQPDLNQANQQGNNNGYSSYTVVPLISNLILVLLQNKNQRVKLITTYKKGGKAGFGGVGITAL